MADSLSAAVALGSIPTWTSKNGALHTDIGPLPRSVVRHSVVQGKLYPRGVHAPAVSRWPKNDCQVESLGLTLAGACMPEALYKDCRASKRPPVPAIVEAQKRLVDTMLVDSTAHCMAT
eukprot:SAG11_NODE_5232_length_1622_cov_1.035456_1_plen_118_part_10